MADAVHRLYGRHGGRAGAPATDGDEDVALERALGSNEVRLSGRVPIGGSWDGGFSVADPARCAAKAFRGVLEARGIRVKGGVSTSSTPLPAGVRVLAAHDGPPMAEMVRVVNKESQNLHAEMLLRLVGLKVKGEGSAAKGHEAVAEMAKRLGVPDGGWGLTDGSGLARTDLLTPRGLVALLAAMDRHPAAAAFRDSPHSGRRRHAREAHEGHGGRTAGGREDRHAPPRERARRVRDDGARRAAGLRDRREQPRGEEPRGGRGHRRSSVGSRLGSLKRSAD
jgi:hypothetical protein